MEYIVGRIPGRMKIDPDAGGHEHKRERKRPSHQADAEDSVEISAEAKRLSAHEDDGTQPEEPPTT